MSRALAGLAAVALAIVGCRTAGGPPGGPQPELRPAELVARLAARERSRRALRAVARLSLAGPAGEGSAKHVVAVERPDRLRFETLGLFGQTLAVLVSDGERFAFYRARPRLLERGRVGPKLLERATGMPLEPGEAVWLLLEAPPVGSPLVLLGARPLVGGGLRLELGRLPGGAAALWRVAFDAAGRLRNLERLRDDGTVRWRARFDDYRETDGEPFARRIRLEFPGRATQVEVHFGRVELNPKLPEGVFQLRFGAGSAPAGAGGRG